MEITKEHIKELIEFLRSSPKDFNQKSYLNCCGAHLARIVMGQQNYCNIMSIFKNNFSTESNPFYSTFKNGDPLKIADWFEKEILQKHFGEEPVEWITELAQPVTILNIDNHQMMIGFYKTDGDFQINGMWDRYGTSMTSHTHGIMRKEKVFTPKIGVDYLVTEEFSNNEITYPKNSVLRWTSIHSLIASVSSIEDKIKLNHEWEWYNFERDSYPLKDGISL